MHIITILVIFFLIIAGCPQQQPANQKPSNPSAAAEEKGGDAPQQHQFAAPPVQVEVKMLQSRPFNITASTTGTSYAYREAQVAASISGLVTAVHIKDGQKVKQGDVLITIEDQIWKSKLQDKQAECRGLQADLERMQSGYLPEEIAEKKATYKEMKAELQYLESEIKRKEELYHKRNISETEWEQIKSSHEAAEAKVQKAEAELKLYERGFRKELIAAAKAAYERCLAQTEEARISVEKTNVLAPFSGFIVQRKVEVGEWVVPGTVVASLVDLCNIKVVTPVPEKYISMLEMGMNAQISMDGLPGKSFLGEVIEITPQASTQDRNFLVKFLVKNSDFSIRAGMFCRLSTILRTVPHALMIHSDAILKKRQQNYAIKVSQTADAEFVPITLGGRDGEWFEILECEGKLTHKDKVVVTNNPSVYPGAKLMVVRE